MTLDRKRKAFLELLTKIRFHVLLVRSEFNQDFSPDNCGFVPNLIYLLHFSGTIIVCHQSRLAGHYKRV